MHWISGRPSRLWPRVGVGITSRDSFISMKHSKLSKGYLVIDHSFSPGLTPEENAAAGRPPEAANGMYEADIIVCNHCPRVLILNPLRQRERGWCSYCDRYLCDNCATTFGIDKQCRNYMAQVDAYQEEQFKLLNVKEI